MLAIFTLLYTLTSVANATEATWEILGINQQQQLIAYKYSYIEVDGEGNSAMDCEYPDVPAGQGVLLGLWSAKEGKPIQTWDIYKSILEDPNPETAEDCVTMREAKKQLQAAKKHYAAQEIDISSHPTGTTPNEDGVYEIVDGQGKKHVFTVVVFEELPIPDEGAMGGYLLKRWIRNASDEIVYSLELKGVKIMASSLSVQFPAAYVVGDQVVFLQQVSSFSMRHSDTSYSFTSPIDLK